jgi:hypothetical protein
MRKRWKELWNLSKGPFNMITDIEPKENFKYGGRHDEIVVLSQNSYKNREDAQERFKVLVKKRNLKPIGSVFTSSGNWCLPCIKLENKAIP